MLLHFPISMSARTSLFAVCSSSPPPHPPTPTKPTSMSSPDRREQRVRGACFSSQVVFVERVDHQLETEVYGLQTALVEQLEPSRTNWNHVDSVWTLKNEFFSTLLIYLMVLTFNFILTNGNEAKLLPLVSGYSSSSFLPYFLIYIPT